MEVRLAGRAALSNQRLALHTVGDESGGWTRSSRRSVPLSFCGFINSTPAVAAAGLLQAPQARRRARRPLAAAVCAARPQGQLPMPCRRGGAFGGG